MIYHIIIGGYDDTVVNFLFRSINAISLSIVLFLFFVNLFELVFLFDLLTC